MLRRFASRVVVGLIALAVIAYSVRSAEARTLRLRQQEPAEGGASPSDVVPASPVQKGGACCPQYSIKYRHHCTLRKTCCSSCETYKTVLQVCDPCCGCTVDIPLCLPCCCEGSPKVCDRSGHFGRYSVTYEWCCGYRVKVVFDRCGDVTVHSYGR